MLYIDDQLTSDELVELRDEMLDIKHAYRHAAYQLVWHCRRCGNTHAGDAIVWDAMMLVSRCRRCKHAIFTARMSA
jgi:predicted Zn-ribbon and HTH transcriptional regulator